ncbi:MAG: L,D-transpeptidase family protein [Hyphomicrobiales bacterium]|nr:L,D-transpeptidase family protein [Hyphomicrobiales bacterium]
MGFVSPQPARAERKDAQVEAGDAVAETAVQRRARERGFASGAPVFIRIFKESSSLEVWLEKRGRFVLFATYKICRWSGELGPKFEEGDRQSPEGIYDIRAEDLRVNARWHRAMGVNFPNAYDRTNARTGSGILIHGKCSSIGCFALTDPHVEEVYDLVDAALADGQQRVLVHIFPFALTTENLAAKLEHPSINFWRELRPAFAAFERDRLPPAATLCGEQYGFTTRRHIRGRDRIASAKCPLLTEEIAVTALIKPRRTPVAALVTSDDAKSCDPKQLRCRLLRIAVASKAACPKKYARCRNPQTAAIKSVDCPLKYPRCRKRGATRFAAIALKNAKRR